MKAKTMHRETSRRLQAAAETLRSRFADWDTPGAILQLGTGFQPDGLFDNEFGSIDMAELGLISPAPSPGGNPLELRLGTIGDRQVLLACGHRYRFEHHDIGECIAPVVAAALAGVRDVILLEPGLALREDLKPGTWVVATDYINAMGVAPTECMLDLIEDPFVDMTDAFSQSLVSDLINAAARTGVNPRLGIYQGTPGPQFDTPAEAESARRNGADVIGNAIIPETVAAALLGCRVTAWMLVTEAAASYHGRRLQHKDVIDAAQFCSADMMRALRELFLEDQINEHSSDEGRDLHAGALYRNAYRPQHGESRRISGPAGKETNQAMGDPA